MISGVKLTDRDLLVLKTIWRFRFCLGRQIRLLCGFSGRRGCDERLRKLIESGYLSRKKYIYGVPSLYMITRKIESVIPLHYYEHKIRLEQILHDISVIDTVIYFMKMQGISLGDVVTAKELHGKDGFSNRKHQADFVIKKGKEEIAVEIELSRKSKERLMKNVRNNFMRYGSQIWIIPDDVKIIANMKEAQLKYPDIEIIDYETVDSFVKSESWGTEDKTET